MKNKLFIIFFIFSTSLLSQKEYHKIFFENGNLKEVGWKTNNLKNGYCKFYYKNGRLKKEGRFNKNLPNKYWYFYSKYASKEKEGYFINSK